VDCPEELLCPLMDVSLLGFWLELLDDCAQIGSAIVRAKMITNIDHLDMDLLSCWFWYIVIQMARVVG
jgi:hypothetical protein